MIDGLAGRMLAEQGCPGRLEVTDDLDRALYGADVVLLQLRVGGQTARLSDETAPLACGCIGQETTGAGGFAKAVRTVPVVLDIAARTRELAADGAWIVDFTNPVGIVTRALLDAGHRAVGLCNVAIGFQRFVAGLLGVPPDQLSPEQVGLPPALLADLGVVPSYYLRYFYAHGAVLAEQATAVPRAAEVAGIERRLLETYRDPALTGKPELLEQRGGALYSEAATQLVASLVSDTGDVQVVDVRNEGALPGLAADDVVEVPAHVGAAGPVPQPLEPLATQLLGLVQHVAAYERLTVRAALSGDRADARRALLAHPLIGQYDVVERLLDHLQLDGMQHDQLQPEPSTVVP